MAGPLSIGVSAATLRGSGSSALGRSLLTALSKRPDIRLSAWVPREWSSTLGLNTTMTVRPGALAKLWHETTLPMQACGADALLSLGDTGSAWPGRPHVLLVQQAHLAYQPTDWGYTPTAAVSMRFAALAQYFRIGQRSVTRYVVQTNDMKKRLCTRWGLDPDRVDVIPSSVLPLPDVPRSVSSGRPFFVCVSSAASHKNLHVLPDILAESKHDWDLHVTASPEDAREVADRARALGVSRRLVWTGHVPRRRVLALLASAHGALQPSHLESFGFGYYEAMGAGCPLVVADRAFAREACESAALYADQARPEEFAHQVDRLLESSLERERFSDLARQRFRASALSWDEVGAMFIDSIRHATQTSR